MSSAEAAPAESAPSKQALSPLFSGPTLAFLSLRLWLGMRSLLTGIEKFTGTKVVSKPMIDDLGMPDASGAMIEVKQKVYGLQFYKAIPDSMQQAFAAQPLLPGFMLTPFYACLGWALIVLGITLLLGLWTRLTLFATAMLYVALTFGLILINEPGGIAWLGIHLGLIAFALTLADKNRLCLTRNL